MENQYGSEEAARQSHFEKLNFEAVRDIISSEGVDCEFKWGKGGYDVFLTDEEFRWAKQELEKMKRAGGYTGSLKIFQGENACKVHL